MLLVSQFMHIHELRSCCSTQNPTILERIFRTGNFVCILWAFKCRSIYSHRCLLGGSNADKRSTEGYCTLADGNLTVVEKIAGCCKVTFEAESRAMAHGVLRAVMIENIMT